EDGIRYRNVSGVQTCALPICNDCLVGVRYSLFHLLLVFMEQGLSYPHQAVITNAAEHDRGQLEVLIDDKACMYVFDRGYLDYERFDRMTDEGYYFVSRLRKNAVVRVLDTFSVPEDS